MPNRTTTVNGLRPCRLCNQTLPATEEYFMPTRKGSPNLRSYCRKCMNKKSAAWRAANPEKSRAARNKWRAKNRALANEKKAEWAAANRDKVQAQRQKARFKQHGITEQQYDELFASQGGGCAICGTTDPGPNSWGIDHDHSCCGDDVRYRCGKCVRGILCAACNTGIGHLRDDPDRLIAAALYLVGHKERMSA